MELRDIQELMQVLKKENLTEMKIKYGNVKLTLTNSETGQVGTSVRKGEILARINTIGIDNDVKATVNGVLKEVLVADGSAVDFAKELFKIEVK